MIPRADITAWRHIAPWSTDAQVEQDLVLSRALVEIYSDPQLSGALAMRGGTALHKLYLGPASRYSEDIDLVQIRPGAIGPLIDNLRFRLDAWLGEPRRKQSEGRMTMTYRFDSEIPPITPLRLKVEVNTREHFSVLNFVEMPIRVSSPWFQGSSQVVTYPLEELLGTKLRAMYQRKKGRDLFDVAIAIAQRPDLDPRAVVNCFRRYMEFAGTRVSRADFEANLASKVTDPVFLGDVAPLLRQDDGRIEGFDALRGAEAIRRTFTSHLPGEPWKGGE
ncbi:MAG: nucleotidyl transferase AbiEii/AbiGii toxin family protein [Bryobacterales bacterium]|nr:nucleotidyl transferase AbiEii/AbiGii toxin family protein [Bryobacterales bacterium]